MYGLGLGLRVKGLLWRPAQSPQSHARSGCPLGPAIQNSALRILGLELRVLGSRIQGLGI
jgi:hypothetical protein